MKKSKLNLVMTLLICCSLTLSSCIGSFGLSQKLLKWNGGIGDKFVNELVFFAFWVLPVYEVTLIADVLVLNSIEFWSGSNPLAANTRHIVGEKGEYLVTSDENGYKITNEAAQVTVEFQFDKTDHSWSVISNGESHKILTYIDKDNVRMYLPEGKVQDVELSAAGTLAFKNTIRTQLLFAGK